MLKNIVIGIIAGLISGFFSTGGGLILVPAFIYFIKLDEKKARATSIACILPMVIASSIFYAKNKFIDWKLGEAVVILFVYFLNLVVESVDILEERLSYKKVKNFM